MDSIDKTKSEKIVITLNDRGNIIKVDNDTFFDQFKYKPHEIKNKFIGKICINDHLLGKTLFLEKLLQKEEILDLKLSILTREGKIKTINTDFVPSNPKGKNNSEFCLTIKEFLSKSDKRTFFRKRTNFGFKLMQDNREFFSHCINISIGGMLVEFNQQLDVLKDVTAKFYPVRLQQEFLIDCNPIWVNTKKNNEVVSSIAGLKFINLNNETLEKLYSFIIEI